MDTRRGARRVLLVATRCLVALVSLAALVATGLGWTLQHRLDTGRVTSRAVADAPPVVEGEAFTALLVGLDSRTDAAGNPLPQAVLDALHAGPDEGQLHTDTMIVLHVPAEPGAPAVAISIPRDSYVPIAGDRGTHKINSAYGRGLADAEETLTAQGVTGAELDRQGKEAGRSVLVQTVEALTGVRIDHFAEINLAGFLDLTEALGGVPVCLNGAVRDTYSGIDLPAGPQTITGPAAVAFVRQRHGLDGGDLDRIARQQAFIAGAAQRLQTAGVLADPGRLDQLVDVVTRHVVLDTGWDLAQAVTQLGRLSGDDLSFHTIPTGRPDLRTPYDGVAIQIDQDAVRAFVGELTAEPATSTAPSASRTSTPETAAPPTSAVVVLPASSPRTTTAAPPRTQLTSPASSTTAPTAAATTTGPAAITAGGVPCVD